MKRHRMKLAAGILAAWVAGLSVLAWRAWSRDDAARLAELAMRVGPDNSFYAVTQGKEQIGFASSTIDTMPEGIEMTDLFVADLPVGGALHRASAKSIVHLTRGLALRDFTLTIDSDAGAIRVTGTPSRDTLLIAIASDGAPADTQRVATHGPVFLPTLVPLAVMLGDEPKVGKKHHLTVFDPTTMAPRKVTMRLAAESLFVITDSAKVEKGKRRWIAARTDTVRAWRLEALGDDGAPSRFTGWVDASGRIVELAQPGDLKMQRMAYELAYENWRLDRRARSQRASTADSDILESTAIAASAPLARGRRERLAVRLTNVDLAGFDLDGGRQRLAADTLFIATEPTTALRAAYTLPVDAAHRARFARELAAEPLLQVNDRNITELAERLRAGSTDPFRTAVQLHRWVFDSLKKEITFGLPNAAQVLAARSGDCNEHTQLYIALARAVGIPARSAAGLAYVKGKFYYHAWPEVFLGDWVAIDPTFGEFPADASHLRFVTGGLDRQAELLRLIGNLKVDVVK